MVRRYAPACLLIMAVSIGSAPLAYKATAEESFRAFCTFQVVVRPPQTAIPALNQEFIKFINTLAANHVAAAAPSVYKEVAKAEKVRPNTIQRQTKITKAPGLGELAAVVNDPQARRATRRANALCGQFVATIKKQRSDQVTAETAAIQGRINTIQQDLAKLMRIAPNRRSAVDKALILAYSRAITQNANLIASIRSTVPDRIFMVAPAENVSKTSSASLRKNLVIATVAGLLVCFLVVLIGESVLERRLIRLGPAARD